MLVMFLLGGARVPSACHPDRRAHPSGSCVCGGQTSQHSLKGLTADCLHDWPCAPSGPSIAEPGLTASHQPCFGLSTMHAACRWAVLVNPLLEKPPTNGALCTAWILQGPFDVSTWLNWYMFYQGQQGVRGRFLDMWEYLAGDGLQ